MLSSIIQFAIWLYLIGSLVSGQIHILPGKECRAILPTGGTLQYEGIDSFMLSLNLGNQLAEEYLRRYQDSGDKVGKECMSNVYHLINSTISVFEKKFSDMEMENNLLQLYMTDASFLGKPKRSAGAVLFAVLISITNLAATSLGIAFSSLKMNDLTYRLELMSKQIKNLERNQVISQNNFEVLLEQNEFLGIQKNVIVDHVNAIKTIHACDVMQFEAKTQISKLEKQLENVLDSLYSKKLSHKLIEFETLKTVASKNIFVGTIFQIVPSLLYDFASVEMVSFRNSVITMLVSFPKIGNKFDFMRYEFIDAPKRIGIVDGNAEFNSFLLPYGMPIDSVIDKNGAVRSAEACLTKKSMVACPNVFPRSNCIESILRSDGIDWNCPMESALGEQSFVTFTHNGALINLRQFHYVKKLNIPKMLYYAGRNETLCIFLPKDGNLILGSLEPGKKWSKKLFLDGKPQKFSLPTIYKKLPKIEPKSIENLTLANFSSTRVLEKPRFETEIDYFYLTIVPVSASVGVTLLLFILMLLISKRCGSTDGGSLFS